MNDAFVTTREDAELVMQRPSNDPIDKIERMEKALRAIMVGAQNQGAFTGMSWAEVERLCKEGLCE